MLCDDVFCANCSILITPVQLRQKIDAGEDILIRDVRHTLDIKANPYIILAPYTFPRNL